VEVVDSRLVTTSMRSNISICQQLTSPLDSNIIIFYVGRRQSFFQVPDEDGTMYSDLYHVVSSEVIGTGNASPLVCFCVNSLTATNLG
jgi:hypothetical protein